MNRLVKRIGLSLFCGAIAMQFVPTRPKPPASATQPMHMTDVITPEVGAILDHSCLDCHSANTRWPWYSRVAPVSWLVARDVGRGRAKLDFSEWASRSHSANERMEICDAVSNGSMPMKIYTLVHRNARLSGQDVDRICDWATSSQTAVSVSKAGISAATPSNTNNMQKESR